MGIVYKASYDDNWENDLMHWRTKGSKNGIRLWQNTDGSYTEAGRNSKPGGRYNTNGGEGRAAARAAKKEAKAEEKAAKAQAKTEARAYGTGQYAKKIRSQNGKWNQNIIGYTDLLRAANDVRARKMSANEYFKVYGKYMLTALAASYAVSFAIGAGQIGYQNLYSACGGDWNNLGEVLKSKGANIIDKAKTTATNVANNAAGTAGLAGDALKEFGTQFKDWATGTIDKIKSGVESADATGAETSVEGVGVDSSALPGQVMYNGPDQTEHYADHVGNIVVDADYKAPETFAEKAADAFTKAKEGATDTVERAKATASDTVDKAVEAAKEKSGYNKTADAFKQYYDPKGYVYEKAGKSLMEQMKQAYAQSAADAGVYDVFPEDISDDTIKQAIRQQYGTGAWEMFVDNYVHNYYSG